MNDFGGDHGAMARSFYGTSREDAIVDAWNDIEKLQRRNRELTEALDLIVSALEDVGMEYSYIHEMAVKASEGQ